MARTCAELHHEDLAGLPAQLLLPASQQALLPQFLHKTRPAFGRRPDRQGEDPERPIASSRL